MHPNEDAYGQEIQAYLRGEEAYEIVERDDGYTNLSGGPEAYFAPYKDWTDTEKQAIKLAKGRILDIGAGAGRIALHLQKRGKDVVSIDNSPLAIDACKKQGVKEAHVLSIEDIGTLPKDTFGTVLMFGNNFGLFGNYKKAKRLLKQIHTITTNDAIILAESNNIYRTKESVHRTYHERNRKRGRMPGQTRLRLRFKQYTGKWFDYLLVSKTEMRDILKGTGWKVRKCFDSGKATYIAVIEKS